MEIESYDIDSRLAFKVARGRARANTRPIMDLHMTQRWLTKLAALFNGITESSFTIQGPAGMWATY